MIDINKALLRTKILHSRELTALEKRYLESRLDDRAAKWEISCDGYYPYCNACRYVPERGKMTAFCGGCGARMGGAAHE